MQVAIALRPAVLSLDYLTNRRPRFSEARRRYQEHSKTVALHRVRFYRPDAAYVLGTHIDDREISGRGFGWTQTPENLIIIISGEHAKVGTRTRSTGPCL